MSLAKYLCLVVCLINDADEKKINVSYSVPVIFYTSCVASFPGPTQLSVACSTDKLYRTASDGKLGGAWERGYGRLSM